MVCSLVLGLLLAAPAGAEAQGVLAYSSTSCEQGGEPATFGSYFGPPGQRGCTSSLWAMDDNGLNPRRLTKGRSEGEEARGGDGSPTWSPAGDRIAFVRQTTQGPGANRLFVMDANGGDQRQLIPGGAPGAVMELGPSWSSRGDAIVFWAVVPPSFGAIYVVAPDGTGLRRVSAEGQTALNPTFAPDGVHILYWGFVMDPSGERDAGVWLTDSSGSTPRRVTAGDLRIGRNALSFSPSGRWVAVTMPEGERSHIYAMRTDGSEIRRIDGAQGTVPVWSGVGNALFYIDGEDAYSIRIFRHDLVPGAIRRPLTEPGQGGGRLGWSAAGRVTSLVPPIDELAPLTLVGAPPGTTGPPPGKLPYLAVDLSGLRRVDAAVGLRTGRSCRFMGSDGKLGARRSCSDPVYRIAPMDGKAWRQRTKRLPKGTYEVRLKATDRRGNTTRKPKRRVVKVK